LVGRTETPSKRLSDSLMLQIRAFHYFWPVRRATMIGVLVGLALLYLGYTYA